MSTTQFSALKNRNGNYLGLAVASNHSCTIKSMIRTNKTNSTKGQQLIGTILEDTKKCHGKVRIWKNKSKRWASLWSLNPYGQPSWSPDGWQRTAAFLLSHRHRYRPSEPPLLLRPSDFLSNWWGLGQLCPTITVTTDDKKQFDILWNIFSALFRFLWRGGGVTFSLHPSSLVWGQFNTNVPPWNHAVKIK